MIVLLMSLMFAALPAAAENFGETRQYFGNWLTACRPNGYCSATGYVHPAPANGTVADYILRIGRQARQTYWELSFTAIAVDARSEAFTQPGTVAAYGSVNDLYLLGDGAQRVMDRLVPGRTASIVFTDTKGVHGPRLSRSRASPRP